MEQAGGDGPIPRAGPLRAGSARVELEQCRGELEVQGVAEPLLPAVSQQNHVREAGRTFPLKREGDIGVKQHTPVDEAVQSLRLVAACCRLLSAAWRPATTLPPVACNSSADHPATSFAEASIWPGSWRSTASSHPTSCRSAASLGTCPAWWGRAGSAAARRGNAAEGPRSSSTSSDDVPPVRVRTADRIAEDPREGLAAQAGVEPATRTSHGDHDLSPAVTVPHISAGRGHLLVPLALQRDGATGARALRRAHRRRAWRAGLRCRSDPGAGRRRAVEERPDQAARLSLMGRHRERAAVGQRPHRLDPGRLARRMDVTTSSRSAAGHLLEMLGVDMQGDSRHTPRLPVCRALRGAAGGDGTGTAREHQDSSSD